MDCFFGRLSGAKGAVWQYTAIDVGSAYCWSRPVKWWRFEHRHPRSSRDLSE